MSYTSIKKGALTIKVFDKNQLTEVAELWQAVEKRAEHVTITNSWDWTETWLNHFGTLVDYYFVVGIKKGIPCGIALVTKETHRPLPFPVKAFHVGTSGEPFQDRVRMSNNSILATDKVKPQFTAALIAGIMQTFSPEELVFDDYDKQSADLISKLLKRNHYTISVDEEPTLYLDLEELRKNKMDVISAFGSNMRRSIRRSLKVFGEITVDWAENPEDAKAILDELVAFYQTTQQRLGRAGMFTSPYFSGFQYEIIKKLLTKNKVILFRVSSKRYGTIGCLYMFVDNNIAYSYQIGLNSFDDVTFDGISANRLKTSYILHALCMQECLKRGFSAYNFLMGVYRYKTEMTNGSTPIVSISVKKSFKPVLRDAIIRLYTKLDENRNSPKLIRFIRKVIHRKNKAI